MHISDSIKDCDIKNHLYIPDGIWNMLFVFRNWIITILVLSGQSSNKKRQCYQVFILL